jgi:DNA helicase-2/ATP-dependent DNA helicase PcrA
VTAAWPVDPLAGRRPDVEAGAELVRAAMADGPDPSGDVREWAHEIDVLLAERDANRHPDRALLALPGQLSASRVVALAADPVALAARLRRPMPEPPSPQARRGSEFHAWLERRFASAALVDLDELPGADGPDGPDGAEELDGADGARDGPGPAGTEELRRRFLESEWAARTAEAVEVAVETPVAGVVLRGRIDAVFRRPDGGWEVVDWKTGAEPGPAAAAHRAVQLAVYRLAWARLQGVPVESVGAAFFYAATGRTVRPVDLLNEAGLESLLSLSGRP